MKRPARQNLLASDKHCPHCKGELELYDSPRHHGLAIRCQRCRCRWRRTGQNWSVGLLCPLRLQLPVSV